MQADRIVVALIVGRLLQIAIIAFQFRLMTEIFDEESLGSLYLVYTFQGFFSLALVSPIGQFLNRHTQVFHYKGILMSALYSQFFFISAMGLLAGPTMILVVRISSIEFDVGVSLLCAGLVASSSVLQTLLPTLNLIGYRLAFVIFGVLQGLGAVVGAVTCVAFFGSAFEYWLLGQILAQMFFSCILFAFLQAKSSQSFWESILKIFSHKILSRRALQVVFNYAVPLSIAAVGLWFIGSGYRWIAVEEIGLSEIGVLSVAVALVTQVFAAGENLYSSIVAPKLFRDVSILGFRKAFVLYESTLVFVLVVCSVALIAFLPQIFHLLVSEDLSRALQLCYVVVILEFVRVCTSTKLMVFTLSRRTKLVFLPNLLSSVCLLFLFKQLDLKTAFDILIPLLVCQCLSLVVSGILTHRTVSGFSSFRSFGSASLHALPIAIVGFCLHAIEVSPTQNMVAISCVTLYVIMVVKKKFGE